MYNIYLSKTDKVVFGMIYEDGMATKLESLFSREVLYNTVKYLESLGLVQATYDGGKNVINARLLPFGAKFKYENPKLKNEVTLFQQWLATSIIALAALVISFFALFK